MDDQDRKTTWVLAATACSVPIVALTMWWSRGDFLDQVDCQTLGPWDCGYDGPTAAAFGAFVGLLFLIGVAGARFIGVRWRRTGVALSVVALSAWLVVAAMLVAATRT